MSLTRFEKVSYIGGPWFLGIVLIVSGLVVIKSNPAKIQGILLTCSGLFCMCLYCVCALLAKIVDTK